jgi:CRP/FNR family transcriptional regulator, cyclic AMP receptor protein
VNWSLSRLAQTAHWLLSKTLLMSSPLVEERVLLMFTLLAERWGKVTREGIALDLPLTRAAMAKPIGARRPSVSTAMPALQARGIISRTDRGYLLPRADSASKPLKSRCWPQCMHALGL